MGKTISFIGDVMLGRIIGSKYDKSRYDVVTSELKEKIKDSDYVIANLESPVPISADTEGDHLQFKGNPNILEDLKWIDLFSLSNNHINDCGTVGMDETVLNLDKYGYQWNGIYKNEYEPYIYNDGDEKIAIVTITDMMNIPFAEDCQWKTLRVGDDKVFEVIKEYHKNGYFVMLYAHIGMLFTRYPNPVSYNYLHKCIDYGADFIVTCHSHCLGGMETYKGKYIFHSLGDFVMDGNSFRRRRSGILKIRYENKSITNWEIIPAEIDLEYKTTCPNKKVHKNMIKSFNDVSSKIVKHSRNYEKFYKFQYKKEMIMHTCSTLSFLCKSRGVIGMFKMVGQRFEEVLRMFTWITKDRSKDQRDDDAIKADRKRFTEDELFK